jgi:hypothetical protein
VRWAARSTRPSASRRRRSFAGSPAVGPRLLAFGSNSKAAELGPVPGEPAIGGGLDHRQRPELEGSRQRARGSAKLPEHDVDRRGAFVTPAVLVDGPGAAVALLPADAVSRQSAVRLTWNDQHTAGPVVPADPARRPGANRSSAVEEEDDPAFGQASTSCRWDRWPIACLRNSSNPSARPLRRMRAQAAAEYRRGMKTKSAPAS